MTNSHAENAQDGQHRPDVSGTPDAQADPQAPDARGGGQGIHLGYGGGPEDQPAGPEGEGMDPREAAGPPAGQTGAGAETPAGSAGAGAASGPGESQDEPRAEQGGAQDQQAAQDEATKRLAKAVLAAEQALIEFEIAVETFRVEVENFSRLHHQRLGPMYARLDELDAQIAEAVAARTGAPEDIRKAQEARASVLPMPEVEELFHGWMGSDGLFPEAQAMLTEQSVQPPQKVRPSEEARKVYRDLVRKAHPDLARDDAERERRDAFIVRANAAYARGDEAVLRELAREWEAGPAPAEERLSESEELYARLEWLAERKELLAAVAAELEESAIGAMIKMAPEDPDALLEEIAEKLLADVSERETCLAQLVG
ncbi:J domain-containing protein [Streptomyces sioyaensis]|uniref:J domain-containing protein n=1 Tax=Streptomyces sioyaensis TaxID=67364 RepID=UPI001F43F69B|nr:J domain-containing protein [Streptomyces sioyaensis]MCF3177224.1 J domain-containing protein [Streptomyces sioyaensis]